MRDASVLGALLVDMRCVLFSCEQLCFFFFSSRRRHTRFDCDWSSDVCSSDLVSPRQLLRRSRPGGAVETAAGAAAGRRNHLVRRRRSRPPQGGETDAGEVGIPGGDRKRGGWGKRGECGGRRVIEENKR